ncbi:MAG: 30S ribosomal protein S12 methylthiotransferase RimO [Firmicutes bacterium]|nr:30S ribosomal protein S12 methylthiotransferase RimO [Bacillota bacterium]
MKIYISTMGCPKNIVDSENLAGLLAKSGHTIVDTPEAADWMIVNTCGFIGDAKEESIARIFELAALKGTPGKGRAKRLLVSGCLSERYLKELYKEMPEVDVFTGVNDYDVIPELIATFEKDHERVAVSCGPEAEYPEFGPRLRTKEAPWTAYLKIAEGCDNVCTYCIIPKIRGPYRSRKQEAILREARKLAAEGVKELVLVAQDVTCYGFDFDGKYHLAELLRELCKIDGIVWIRLLYCYEDRITDELIDTIKDEPKICKYIDIPLQHASTKILKAMKRRSTFTSTERTLKKLRRKIPGIVVRTTLITGFPGETKEDFKILYDFVASEKFGRLGVFPYSKEEGTEAATMPNQIRKDVKERRRDRIMELQRTISLDNNLDLVNQILPVLIEEEDGFADGVYTYLGRSEFDAPEIDNAVIVTSDKPLAPGTFVDVRILDAYDYDLLGKAVSE